MFWKIKKKNMNIENFMIPDTKINLKAWASMTPRKNLKTKSIYMWYTLIVKIHKRLKTGSLLVFLTQFYIKRYKSTK